MTRRTEIEIEYALQDNGKILVNKIRGFPTVHPNESPEEYEGLGFFIFRDALYRKTKDFHGPLRPILCKNLSRSKKYFDKVRNLLIQDICSVASAKKKILISVPDTGILVEVKNASSGQNLYTVTTIKALAYDELPEIYTQQYTEYNLPAVWQYRDELLTGNGATLLEVGESYSYGALKKALCYIELAGRHLAQAKAHYSEEARPSWAKCDTITFKDGKVQRTTTATSPRISSFREGLEMDLGAVDISRRR